MALVLALALALALVVVEEEEEEEEDWVVFRLLFLLSWVGFLVRLLLGISLSWTGGGAGCI